MRILDRYVLLSFLRNYLISFMVLMGLYIVLDMVFNFDELASVRGRAGGGFIEVAHTIVSYYFYQSFLIFVQLSGVIPVVAAAFTLVRLSRFNELTAILASGVPLLRTAAPIILAAVALNVLLIVDQEIIIPRIIPNLTRAQDELRQGQARAFPIRAMQDSAGGLLFAARYYPAGIDHQRPVMIGLDVIRVDEDFRPVSHILADRAEWNEKLQAWELTGGTQVTGLGPLERRSEPRPIDLYKSGVTPEEIALYRSGDFVELLSTERINQLLKRPQSYGTVDLLRVKHTRFTQPLLNVVMLLLAIPCVLTRQPLDFRIAGTKLFLLVGLCMAAIFLSHQIAGNPPSPEWFDRWPALMAWMPLLIFAPIAVFLMDRIKS